MAGNVYGLDLGTYEIKVYDKKKDAIWQEKNTIAMKGKKYIFATGNRAYEMFEKSPDDIEVVFPMKDGVIAHFDDMQYLLGTLLETERRFVWGAQYVIAVPTDVTEVEKKAFYDLVFHSEAKAKSVRIVERGLADAVGCGMDVLGEKGLFVANFGSSTTELSVLSQGGMVMNRLLKTGGEDFDSAVVSLVRHNMDFLIGASTAEKLRREFGVFDQCVRAVRSMLERTPPDVRRAIMEKGICLTGGVANLRGLSTYLQESIGLPVIITPEPELCAVKGLQKIISDRDYYKRLTYSMLDEDYRWLR